jgi:GGDEF domain-containing protein
MRAGLQEPIVHKDFEPTSIEPDGRQPVRAAAPGFLRALLQRLRGARGGRDEQTGLHSRQGLLELGDRLVARTGREAALAIFDFQDLLEVRGMYGSHVSEALRKTLVERLLRLAGRHGLAARTGPAQFAVLLPATRQQEAADAIFGVFGRPCRLELDLPDDDLVLVPEVTVDTCGPGEGAVWALYERLSVRLARHREHQELRRTYLRRSRERHSRPAPLHGHDDHLDDYAVS